MRPLTDTLPKPLLQVRGRPLIAYHIEKLVRSGITDIVINHAWLGNKLLEQLGDGRDFGVNLHYSPEQQALETAGGIVKALPLLCPEDAAQCFIVINGDVFCDFDFSSLPEQAATGCGHLVMVPNPEHNPDGDFGLKDGHLTLQGPMFTFSGIALYHRSFFDGLEVRKQPLAPLFRQKIADQCMTGQLHQGQWCDVGTPERLQILNETEE